MVEHLRGRTFVSRDSDRAFAQILVHKKVGLVQKQYQYDLTQIHDELDLYVAVRCQ